MMDEKTKDALLAEYLLKQSFRANRHRTRPSSLDVVRLMLLSQAELIETQAIRDS